MTFSGKDFNPFSTNVSLLYTLKICHLVSNVFRGYRSETLVENGLMYKYGNVFKLKPNDIILLVPTKTFEMESLLGIIDLVRTQNVPKN